MSSTSEPYRGHPNGGDTDRAVVFDGDRDALEVPIGRQSGALTLDKEAVEPGKVAAVKGEDPSPWLLWDWRDTGCPACAQLACQSCLFASALQFGAAPRT